jgi:propionyl-CoA carboxylase alpha chain
MDPGRPIGRLLVANRGEIARRVFAACRRMGIATVAVHSEPDADAPFVAEADEAVALGGQGAADSYLRAELLLEAADRTGADAVHPGYGFLAENAEFARAVLDAGLTWVGPPPEAIAAMGSKVGARSMMERAGVPVLAGAELGSDVELEVAAERVGFPLLVKASAGGGGKGMRTVADPGALAAAVEAARREAASSFGDETVFLERFLERPRHVEIQVLADAHGTTVSLGERDCSVQRRHQKVVEESPSPAVGPELRERMGAAAVAAAEAVGYVGAGTVEFLLGPEGDFYFLEMNTRLQVEHPVTEMVCGLDLVRLQLLVAAGEPLPAAAREATPRGHAIEVRLYAEDPANDYLPQTGRLDSFSFPGEPFAPPDPASGARPPLRLDSGVERGGVVSPFYDPMLAKLIAWAPTRAEAARALASGLERGELAGVVGNRDFLVRILRHPAFLAGEADTGFLARHEGLAEPLADAGAERVHAAAAALAGATERHARGPLGFTPPGWRNNPALPATIAYVGRQGELRVEYRFRRDRIEVAVDGSPLPARVHGLGPEEADLELDGVRRSYRIRRTAERVDVFSPLGHTPLRELPRHPGAEGAEAEGALVAPMPGRVLRLGVAAGEEVGEGALVAVLEAMKMEHELIAPSAGKVAELRVAEGDQVEAGTVLAVIEAA